MDAPLACVPVGKLEIISQIEHLLEDLHSVIRIIDRMPNRSRVLIDLIVVATLESLVAKEVDLIVLDTIRKQRIRLDMLQAVRLVPACRKYIKGYLTSDRVTIVQVNATHI